MKIELMTSDGNVFDFEWDKRDEDFDSHLGFVARVNAFLVATKPCTLMTRDGYALVPVEHHVAATHVVAWREAATQ